MTARQTVARAMTEKELQDYVVALARLLGYHVHHCRPAPTRDGRWATHIQGDPGFCDLVLANGQRLLFVELKSSRGQLTPEQNGWLAALRVTGVEGPVETYCWRPQEWLNGVIEEVLRGEEL